MANITEINFKELKFSDMKRGFLNVFYNKKNLSIMLPKLRIPFGASVNDYGQVVCDFSLDKQLEVIEEFKKFDYQILQDAYNNRGSWFGDSNLSLEDLTEMYIPTLKQSRNLMYSPNIRVKLDKNRDSEINTKFYSSVKNDQGDYPSLEANTDSDVTSLLKKNTHCRIVMDCVGLWYKGDKFGITWKMFQVKVFPDEPRDNTPAKTVENYAFVESDSDSDTGLLGE